MGQKKLIDLENALENPFFRGAYRTIKAPLETALGVPQLNEAYEAIRARYAQQDAQDKQSFFDLSLERFKVGYAISDDDRRRIPSKGPVICVSNHPFGGIDGIIMGSILQRARPDYKLLANFLLNAIEEIRENLFQVNPFSSRNATRMNAFPLKRVLQWLKDGHCLGTFPAGVVSHFQARKRMVTDPAWNPNIASIAKKSQATVIPFYFEGRNSLLFQAIGLLHPKLRTALLGRQLTNKSNWTITVRIGNPISPQRLARFSTPQEACDFMRMKTYILALRDAKEKRRSGTSLGKKTAARRLEPIAKRLPVERLLGDIDSLPEDALLTRQGSFAVYHAKAAQIPNILHEIGRTREETFRVVDEGTGKPSDIDKYDSVYSHLFMWDEGTDEIVGAYRYCFVDQIVEKRGVEALYCHTLYDLKPELLDQLNPALELGRSYIATKYQRKKTSLALLWKGIGSLVGRYPAYKTLFGAVSMTDAYNSLSKALMMEYLKRHKFHPTLPKLMRAKVPPRIKKLKTLRSIAFNSGLPELDDVSSLVSEVEKDNKGVPTLLKHYLRLNGVVLCFGIDQAFSDALDGFIVVDLFKTNRRLLRKYLGNEAYDAFASYHKEQFADEAVGVAAQAS